MKFQTLPEVMVASCTYQGSYTQITEVTFFPDNHIEAELIDGERISRKMRPYSPGRGWYGYNKGRFKQRLYDRVDEED